MINTKKILLIIFILLIPSVAIYSTIYSISKSREEVKGVSNVISGCTPYIMNMIPNVAYINTEYIFYPRIVGCKMSEVEIEINGVEWLQVNERKYIYGVPTISDIGTHKVEILVKSITSSSKLVDYIIVK